MGKAIRRVDYRLKGMKQQAVFMKEKPENPINKETLDRLEEEKRLRRKLKKFLKR